MANQGEGGHHGPMSDDTKPTAAEAAKPNASEPGAPQPVPAEQPKEKAKKVEEIGGPPVPEPTRYGDWQFNGKVTDF